jgi:hypothetical protein
MFGEGKDLFRICLLLLGLTVSIVGQPMAACHSITLTGELRSGDRFEKVIGESWYSGLNPNVWDLMANFTDGGSAWLRCANLIATIYIQ